MDKAGNTGDFSDPFTFTVVANAPVPSLEPVLKSPVDGRVITNATPTFEWSPVTDDLSPVTYTLEIATGDIAAPFFSKESIPEPVSATGDVTVTLPVAQVLAVGDYLWRVRAVDGAGNSGDSGLSGFRIVEDTTVIRFTLRVPVIEKPIAFGPQHIFQLRPVVTGSRLRGGIESLLFSDQLTTADTFTVAGEDSLPLGEHIIRVSGRDRLGNTSRPVDAELPFKVSKLLISLQAQTPTVLLGGTATVTVGLNPAGLDVQEVDSFITFGPQLQVSSITAAPGVTITPLPATADLFSNAVGKINFKATFDPRTTSTNLAIIQFSAVAVGTANVAFDQAVDRKTVGRFEGRDIPAVLSNTTVTVNAPPPPPPPPPPPAVVVVVDTPPVAVAGPAQTVAEGDAVSLDGTGSSDPEALALTFSWTQTDGPTVSLAGADTATPFFVAADNGIFTFDLTVTDPGGQSGTDTVVVTATNVAPTVEAGPAQTVKVRDPITIAATFSDPGFADTHSAIVNWGDGSEDTFGTAFSPVSASHTYTQGGSFTVVVTVTDDDGGVGTDALTVTVQENKPPIAEAGDDQTVVEGATVVFAGTASSDVDGTIATYAWDFGDDGTGVGPTVTHVYADNDTFTVTLIVTDNEGATGDADTAVVTVNNVAPTVRPGDDRTSNEGTDVGITFTFDDAGTLDTHRATIDWGDATQPTTIEDAASPIAASHVYSDGGTFSVAISVIDDDEGAGSGDLTVIVDNVAPEVDAGPGQSAFVGDPITIESTFTDVGTADTHTATIDWGDGTVEQGDVTEANGSGTVDGTHEYDAVGSFPVTVTVVDDNEGVGTGSLEVLVLTRVARPEEIEISDFTLSTNTPVPPETVTAEFTITNTSQNPVILTIDVLVNGTEDFTFEFDEGLPGGGSRVLEHTVIRREPGTYAVQIFD